VLAGFVNGKQVSRPLAPHGSIVGNALAAPDPALAAARPASPGGGRPPRQGCATSRASRDSRDRRPPARRGAAADRPPWWPLCRRPDPAPALAPIVPDRYGEALAPMGCVGRRDCRRRDEVRVFRVRRRPIHGTRQRDRAVDHHCLGVRDPHVAVDPDRHARGGQ
jgi:hypothetical protein